MSILNMNFEKLESNEQNGHFAYQKEYVRNKSKGGMTFIDEQLIKNQR